ncbi:MAG TPA: sugar ABC transporter permease [Rubrobacter sp.]|jgi:multiple sugar transport system permease protein|nr:sugar ABC transporter permease [Rubrobacter sp.]
MTTQQIGQPGAQPPAAAKKASRRGDNKDFIGASPVTPYLFMAPYLVLFLVFVAIPVVYGLWISLHTWDYLLPGKPFVGLQNYVDLFTPGSTTSGPFWNSMENTGKYTLYSVPLLIVIPLLVALVLNQQFRGRAFFRGVFFAPYVLGVAVIGILWRFLLDPNVGLVNFYLGQLGIGNIPWITALPWAWVSLVGATVWWTLGFNTVIYLAGLQDIPRELYEAAAVDGANAWQRFLNITIPGLQPVLLFIVSITILREANMFGQSYIITQGAPGEETTTAIMYIAETGLRQFNMGAAAAMAYVLAFFLLLISIANFVFFRQREN